jgi:nucleoside phosphorylase
MSCRNPVAIFVSDLRDSEIANSHWFEENSPRGMAGRCLVDAMEYLHSIQKFPARFWHVVNAHAVRLVHRCLTDQSVNKKDVLDRMARHIEDTCQQLLKSRQNSIPYFGDDFWDWASVINAFAEVKDVSASAKQVIDDELAEFCKAVKNKMPDALSTGDPEREWYGPATAALAYRVLNKLLPDTPDLMKVLKQLKPQALQKIENGKHLGHDVPARLVRWHYGQVVALFADEATEQASQLADFSWQGEPLEKSERVYTLARVLQGAYAAEDKKTIREALEQLYKYQSLGRPLGQGLMGDTVKGSLNVLDALWPNLHASEKTAIGGMVDALILQYAKANTIGFQVAIPFEANTLESELRKIGADVGPEVSGVRTVKHRKFRAVIRQGKSNADAATASTALIETNKAKWIIMCGIAGSLGTTQREDEGAPEFVGPTEGDVIVATSLAPFRLRQKTRQTVETAAFPYGGSTWMIIPAHPQLFRLAHNASEQSQGEFKRYYEGQIVTGNGILDSKDNPHGGKKEVLKEFPGGLAIEEEGYQMGIVCLSHDVPYLSIRAISDLAEGGKRLQGDDKAREAWEQKGAGRAAASLATKVALLLSEEW